MRPGKPVVYEAVPPREAFGYRLYKLRTDADRKIKSMEGKVDAALPILEKISNLKPNRSIGPEDVAWVYYNEERFQNSITELLLGSSKSYCSFTSKAAAISRQDIFRSRIGAINVALEKGVDVTLIQLIDETMELSLCSTLTRKGAKIMVPPVELKESFWIIDSSTVALLVKDEAGKFRYGLVVQDQFISSLLDGYFFSYYEKSVPVDKFIEQLQAKGSERDKNK
jgi:sugar-specific transcriptional regulator TrmB